MSQFDKINFFKQEEKIYDKYLFELKNFSPYMRMPNYSNNSKYSYHLF